MDVKPLVKVRKGFENMVADAFSIEESSNKAKFNDWVQVWLGLDQFERKLIVWWRR